MKRLIECTACGYQYQVAVDSHNDWLCIRRACCPVCTSDLPPDSDPVWDDPNWVTAAQTEHRPVFTVEEKSLYISGFDKAGVFRFSIPSGSEIPPGIIAGKGWTLKTEYRTNLRCSICGDYLFDERSECSCNNKQEPTITIDGITVYGDPEEFAHNEIYRGNINDQVSFIKQDPQDYGSCPSCTTGRIRWEGGSRYACCECGKSEIRPMGALAPFTE